MELHFASVVVETRNFNPQIISQAHMHLICARELTRILHPCATLIT